MSYLPNPALKKSDILSDSTAFPGADVPIIRAAVDTEVAAIKAKTDNLPASPAAQTKLDTLATDYTTTRAGYLDFLNSAEYTGTVSAGTAVETTLKEIVTTARIEIKSIWLDLNNLTANATLKLYTKVDGTNYRVFETEPWYFASDDKGVLITGFSINNDFKITITGSEGAGVNIPYNIVYQTME